MGLRADFSAFLSAPMKRKLLALEAAAELARARVDTLRHASRYTRFLGSFGEQTQVVREDQQTRAVEIGDIVARVAARMPFRALCLQQALAVRRMLARRSVPTTVYLGLAQDAGMRSDPTAGEAAHAWVKTGDRVISGDTDLERFVVVGAFS